MAFNPYHEWLGLDSKIQNPHYFQLLNVSSKIKDEAAFQNKVRDSAHRNLEKLNHIDAGQRAELLQELKSRIIRAQETLSNPEKRKIYVKKLKMKMASAQPSKVSPKSTTSPVDTSRSTTPARSPNSPDLLPPHRSAVAPSAPTEKVKDTKTFSGPEIVATPMDPSGPMEQTTTSEVPAAVPMAVPLSPPAATSKRTEPAVAINSEGLPVDEVKISKVRSKRKKSHAGLVVLGLMIIAAIAGVVAVVLNFESLLRISGIDAEKVASAPGVLDTTLESQPASTSPDNVDEEEEKGSDLAVVDIDSLPELDIDEVMEHPATLEVTNRDVESERERAADLKTRLEMEKDADPFGFDNGSMSDATEERASKPTKSLSFDQLAAVRTNLERARKQLKRRDKAGALSLIDSSRFLIDDHLRDDFELPEDQKHLQSLVAATKLSMDLLEGFWRQVMSSCQGIPGGQEIRVGQQVVGFVEANETEVTLRNAGTNISYPYPFLPPGLAVALAEQGAKEDVPTWRLQLATFYSLYGNENADYEANAERLISLSENDGHEVELHRRFVREDLKDLGLPSAKTPLPDKTKLAELIEDFRAKNGLEDPKATQSDSAKVLADQLMAMKIEDIGERAACLDEARRLAIRGKDAYYADDACEEIGKWFDIDIAKLRFDSFLQIAGQEIDYLESRKLLESAIPFLKSNVADSLDERKKQQLVKKINKLAERYELTDALRRISQIE